MCHNEVEYVGSCLITPSPHNDSAGLLFVVEELDVKDN